MRVYIAEAAEASLKRLQVDVIDLYLSHWPDMATPIEETLGAYQRLIEQGKIRWCGASNLSVKLIEAALAASKAEGLPRYEVLQPEYNLADRNNSKEALPLSVSASRSASSPISVSPRDFLRVSTAARPTSPRARAATGSRLISISADFASSTRSRPSAARHKAKPAEVALAWAMARPGVTAPIASATSLEQTESLVRATELVLSPADMDALNAASAP